MSGYQKVEVDVVVTLRYRKTLHLDPYAYELTSSDPVEEFLVAERGYLEEDGDYLISDLSLHHTEVEAQVTSVLDSEQVAE